MRQEILWVKLGRNFSQITRLRGSMNKRHAFGEAARHLQGADTGNLVRSQG